MEVVFPWHTVNVEWVWAGSCVRCGRRYEARGLSRAAGVFGDTDHGWDRAGKHGGAARLVGGDNECLVFSSLFYCGGEVRQVIAISGSKTEIDDVDPLLQAPVDCAENNGEGGREPRVEDLDR